MALDVAMNLFAFWNSFHDGTIENISGIVPGDVSLDVSILYLRQRFNGAGRSFRVTLFNCSQFEYQPYDEQWVTDLSKISELEPMMLSIDSEEPLVIDCVMGTLRLAYTSVAIATDAGELVTPEQLKRASVEYWAEWSARHRGNL
jgi:hypothetical protein